MTSSSQPPGPTPRTKWPVQLIDENGTTTEAQMKVQDIWNLQQGQKIILPFSGPQPCTPAAGLLGQWLGVLGGDFNAFPISYESWHMMPGTYKDRVWEDIIKTKIYVEAGQEQLARSYILQDIGKKWRDRRGRLFNKYYDTQKSREENIENHPPLVQREQWATFIDYRMKSKTQEICATNTKNRGKLTINHTGGSKKLNLKKEEMRLEHGHEVSRGMVYIATHRKKDGTYHSDEAQNVCEKIAQVEVQVTVGSSVAENDSLGQVLGKEHSGRVRGMGFGVSPSQVFGSSGRRYVSTSGASSASTPDPKDLEIAQLKEKVCNVQGQIGLILGFLKKQYPTSSNLLQEMGAVLNRPPVGSDDETQPAYGDVQQGEEDDWSDE